MPPIGGASISIEMSRIHEYFPPSFLDYIPNFQSKYCIQRVDNQFRTINQQDYEPVIIAIGPYYRRKSNLKRMERLKFYYLKSLLDRKGENLKLCFEEVRKLEDQARKSYAELPDLNPDELVPMLVLDGCFIVELLIKYDNESGLEDINDEIFQNDWILKSLQRDLLLFENQIPFCVLLKLFKIIRESNSLPCKDFVELAMKFFGGLLPGIGYFAKYKGIDEFDENIHLLGLIYENWLPIFGVQEKTSNYKKNNSKLIRSVSELREAGVTFEKKADDRSLLSIKFRDGTLEIPCLRIEDSTECFFRNLIAYEQHYVHIGHRHIISYAKFLGCLVKSPCDVQILQRHGIINNKLSDEAVCKVFNNIIGPITDPENQFHYLDVVSEVNAYCSKRRNRWMAMLWHEYLHSPWVIISVVAGFLLLVMTLVQAIYSAASYYKV